MVPAIAGTQGGGFGVQAIEIPSLPRLWLISGSRLVQLQTDRFVYNWRRIDDSSGQYPGFETIFAEFQDRWREFLKFSGEAFKIPVKVTELNLTYVNQIHNDVSIETPMFSFRDCNFDMPTPDLWVSQLRFAFPESNMRLMVGARPAMHVATQESVSQFDITVESISAPTDIDDTFAWYESAHALVHRAFKALTGAKWREKWGFEPE